MAIVKMKRLRLLAMRSDQTALLRQLRKLGCVEISQPQDPEDGESLFAQPDDRALGVAAEEASSLESALAVLKREAPVKEGLLKPRPRVAEAKLFDDGLYRSALERADKINAAMGEVNAAQAQQSKLESQLTALEPWLDITVPLNTTWVGDVAVLFGGVSRRTERETLTDALSAATDLYEVTWAGEDREFRYLMLLCHRSALEDVQRVLAEQGFNRLNMKDYAGSAQENHRTLEAELTRTQEQMEQAHETIASCAEGRDELKLALDRARSEMSLEQNRRNLMDTQSAFYLEGWLPAEREGALEELLRQYTVAWETAEPTPEEYPQVPIKLKNNPLTASMNPITEMYSMPAYDGVDPNPFMLPFFILFFGFMMNDMAYGLVMVLATALYIKMARPKESKRNFMMLFLLCGVTTFFWGALTGSFMGDFIPKLTGILGNEVQLPHLFTPMDDTVAVMIGSLVLGVIQVFTGMAISVGHKFRHGEALDAVFDEISWWIIIGGGVWAILGGGNIALGVLAVGGLMLLVGGTRKNKGFGKVTGAVGILYNGISGFFSDILSYVRLMALMLAGSVIASVFNTLGATFGSVIPFIIISLIGNVLNLALNLLGCYVHTLRLQCLEFFGRFYKEGGKPFKPLAIDTNYVEVMKEE